MKHVTSRPAAPPDLGTPMISVPVDSTIELDLRLEAVVEGVLVSGTAFTQLSGECSRCLEPITDELSVEIRELYYYPERATDDPDDDIPQLVDDRIDLEPTLRDALVLNLPLSPVCEDDCEGLCPGCGRRWVDLDSDHSHTDADPRWAALSTLTENKEKD
jgi:uncharacterized protein